MCQCTPAIKTPFCGRGDCVAPPQPDREVGKVIHIFTLAMELKDVGYNLLFDSNRDIPPPQVRSLLIESLKQLDAAIELAAARREAAPRVEAVDASELKRLPNVTSLFDRKG